VQVRECSDFASSFNLPTPYWDAFYQSGMQGKIRHTFQQVGDSDNLTIPKPLDSGT
jgi:hypothetical protein